MKKIAVVLFAFLSFNTNAQVYYNLSGGPFLQNWSNTNLITVNDNWAGVPFIIGYLGDDGSTTTAPVNPQNALAALYSQTIDVVANQNNPATATSGGVAEFEITNPVIALQGSGTADAPNIVLYINSTGLTGIRVKYLLRDIDGSGDNSVQPVALQYRIGNTGNFIDVPAAFVADASGGPNLATLETQVDVLLPAACDNQPELQLRIITGNAVNNDEWIGIDDIEIKDASADATPPVVSTLNPANNATNIALAPVCTVTFSETVQKGTGTITIKRSSDNTTVQSFDVTSASVTVIGSSASFTASLSPSTQYYIEITAGAFKDLALNSFAGITGANTWSFTTGTGTITSYNFDFNSCTIGGIPGNSFSQFSVSGDSVWKCTSFGFGGTNGTQITGFSVVQGALLNEDWLISPLLNLTGFTVPLLKFRCRTRFNGLSLKLFISTNYSGTGNPAAATWTEINGRFPELNSDVWTLCDSINLNNFKSATTSIAWVYYSNPASGAARWTLDDVSLYSNAVAPQPSLTITNVLPRLINFGITPNGNTSASRSFSFWANEVNGNLSISAPAGFELSKDNSGFTTSLAYTNAELNAQQTVFIRFKPNAPDAGFGGTLNFASSNLTASKIDLTASSLPKNKSLDIVNWNLTWFGSPSNPPTNDALQLQNAKTVMDSLDADLYVLQEIVDTTQLGILTRSLQNGPYDYFVSLYGSGAADNNSPNWPTTQKLAYIYRTNLFTAISVRAFTAASTNANNNFNWSSGRYPFLFEANVTVDGISKRISFLNIHAKAELGVAADYQRRKDAAALMADSLNTFFPSNHLLIAGDYNDDLDETISTTAGTAITPYISFTGDAVRYSPLSLWNSVRGESSYISRSNVIDHSIASNEMNLDYHAFSSVLITDAVKWVNAYADSLTDHIPLLTRFNLRLSAVNVITSVRNITASLNFVLLAGNPSSSQFLMFKKRVPGNIQLQLTDMNGRALWQKRLYGASEGQKELLPLQQLARGIYLITVVSSEGRLTLKLVK